MLCSDVQCDGALTAILDAGESDNRLQSDYVWHKNDTAYQRLDNYLSGADDRSWYRLLAVEFVVCTWLGSVV